MIHLNDLEIFGKRDESYCLLVTDGTNQADDLLATVKNFESLESDFQNLKFYILDTNCLNNELLKKLSNTMATVPTLFMFNSNTKDVNVIRGTITTEQMKDMLKNNT